MPILSSVTYGVSASWENNGLIRSEKVQNHSYEDQNVGNFLFVNMKELARSFDDMDFSQQEGSKLFLSRKILVGQKHILGLKRLSQFSICPSVRPSVRPSVFPSVRPSVPPAGRPSAHLSVCQSIMLSKYSPKSYLKNSQPHYYPWPSTYDKSWRVYGLVWIVLQLPIMQLSPLLR